MTCAFLMFSLTVEISLVGVWRGVGGGQLPNFKTLSLVLPSYLEARAAQGHCPRWQISHSQGWHLKCLGDPLREWGGEGRVTSQRPHPPKTRPIRKP